MTPSFSLATTLQMVLSTPPFGLLTARMSTHHLPSTDFEREHCKPRPAIV
jgi:hypothetical protein